MDARLLRATLATLLFSVTPALVSAQTAAVEPEEPRVEETDALEEGAPGPEGVETDAPGDVGEAEPDEIAFDLTAGTHFPVSVGIEGQLELPARVLVRVHLGWMPSGYVDVINGVATAFNWYDQVTADLVSAAIDQAFVGRIGVGWRPFANEGFEFSLGYSLVIGGGSVTSAEAIEAASGRQVAPRGDAAVPLRTTLHALHARIAWRWILAEHFVIRAAVGYVHTIHADTAIDLDVRTGAAIDLAETYLDDILTSYGLSPELQLTAGYRF